MASVSAGRTVEEPVSPPTGTGTGSGDRPRPDRRRQLAAAAALVLLAAGLVLTAVARAPGLSLLDEWTHADYAYRISHGQVPADGDVISRQIREEWSCHGLGPGGKMPPCGMPDPPPGEYKARGEQYNAFHPPVYYLLTGVVARAVDAVRPGQNFITSARVVGLAWLLAGMAVLSLAVRRLGASWPLAALGAALLPLTPIVLHASSTVTNDAPAALAGALGLLVLARVVVDGRTGWLVPAAATLFAAGTKMLNALPLLVVAGLLTLLGVRRWREGERGPGRQLVVVAVAIVGTFLLTYLAWSLFQSGRGVEGWVNPVAHVSGRPVRGLPFDELLSTSFSGFGLTSSYYLQSQVNGQAITAWAKLLTALVIAAPFVALALFRRWSPGWLVGLGLLAGMVLYPLAVEIQVYVSSGLYFPAVVVRYGMSFIPWAIAALVLVAAERRVGRVAAAVTGLGALMVVPTVAGLL